MKIYYIFFLKCVSIIEKNLIQGLSEYMLHKIYLYYMLKEKTYKQSSLQLCSHLISTVHSSPFNLHRWFPHRLSIPQCSAHWVNLTESLQTLQTLEVLNLPTPAGAPTRAPEVAWSDDCYAGYSVAAGFFGNRWCDRYITVSMN